MRYLQDHQINQSNDAVTITVLDEPGEGGANHQYQITAPGTPVVMLKFQQGAMNESALNGITNEALLAVVIDRLRGFQQGQFPSRENAIALTRIEEALMWLHRRTVDRTRRGVEGRSVA